MLHTPPISPSLWQMHRELWSVNLNGRCLLGDLEVNGGNIKLDYRDTNCGEEYKLRSAPFCSLIQPLASSYLLSTLFTNTLEPFSSLL
jgi:hypothetical protein